MDNIRISTRFELCTFIWRFILLIWMIVGTYYGLANGWICCIQRDGYDELLMGIWGRVMIKVPLVYIHFALVLILRSPIRSLLPKDTTYIDYSKQSYEWITWYRRDLVPFNVQKMPQQTCSFKGPYRMKLHIRLFLFERINC